MLRLSLLETMLASVTMGRIGSMYCCCMPDPDLVADDTCIGIKAFGDPAAGSTGL